MKLNMRLTSLFLFLMASLSMAGTACASFLVPDGSITTAKIASNAVTSAKIASGAVASANLASSLNLPGKTVQENGNNLIVSNTNAATNSLAIIRGTVAVNAGDSGASVIYGEGFTISYNPGVNVYTFTLTWSTAFADAPVVLVSNYNATSSFPTYAPLVNSSSTTGATVFSVSTSAGGTANPGANWGFSFIAIGQRQ